MKEKKTRIYMAVTTDKFSLPLAVASSASELAKMLGVNENTVYRGIWNSKNRKFPKYVMVEVDDGEDFLRDFIAERKARKKRIDSVLDKKAVASRLKEIRIKSEKTKRVFSNVLGISESALESYEAGKTIPRADVLYRLSVTTGISIDWILGLSDDKNGT